MNRGLESIGSILQKSMQQWQHNRTADIIIERRRLLPHYISYLPTIMTRLSPFFPISKSDMKTEAMTESITVENSWGSLKVSGRMLYIYDETVMLALMAMLKKSNVNIIETTLHELCKVMGVKPAKDTYNAIRKSLQRMTAAHIIIEKGAANGQLEMDGPIIIGMIENEARNLAIELNPYFLNAISNHLVTTIDTKLRAEFGGDIAKALYRFFEGQRPTSYCIGIVKLIKVINIDSDCKMYSLRWKLKIALRELEICGYLERFLIPDKGKAVAISKSKYNY